MKAMVTPCVFFLSIGKGNTSLGRLAHPRLLMILFRFFNHLSESRWNYVASFFADAAAILLLLALSIYDYRGEGPIVYGTALFFGVLTWTLYEYVFHRWLFHGNPSPLTGGHQKHHEQVDRLLSMPFLTGPAIYAGLYFTLRSFFSDGTTAAFTFAYALSYLYYGFLHHSSHFMEINLPFWKRMRAHHLLHHKFPDKNFGFTTTIWDRVFRTHYPRIRAEREATGI